MDEPAGFGGTCLWLCPEPKQNGGHAFLRGGERKATAGRQIESLQCARNLDYESANAITGQNVSGGAQGIFAVRHAQQDKIVRVEAEFEKSVCVRCAKFQ